MKIRRLTIAAALVAVVLSTLAACGSVPQPFRGTAKVTRDNPILDVPSATGVALPALDGLDPEMSDRFTAAIASQLEAWEIPAAAVPRIGSLGFLVTGHVPAVSEDPLGTSFDVSWTVKARDGKVVGRFVRSARITPGPGGETAAATAAAKAIASSLGLSEEPVEAQRTSAPEKSPYPSISVKPVEGAPGDGREGLALAVLQALSDAGARRNDVNPDVTLFGKMETKPSGLDSQQVTISWRAVTRDQRELGVVKVENTIPTGALAGSWGPTAFAIAAAVQQDLLHLITAPPPHVKPTAAPASTIPPPKPAGAAAAPPQKPKAKAKTPPKAKPKAKSKPTAKKKSTNGRK